MIKNCRFSFFCFFFFFILIKPVEKKPLGNPFYPAQSALVSASIRCVKMKLHRKEKKKALADVSPRCEITPSLLTAACERDIDVLSVFATLRQNEGKKKIKKSLKVQQKRS